MLEHAPLEAVFIYFDTATYDEIERDEKVRVLVEESMILILNLLFSVKNGLNFRILVLHDKDL